MVGLSRFWICVMLFVLGTCQGANIKSGDEVYLENDTCALHKGWIKCTTLPLNRCTTHTDDYSSLKIYNKDNTDIKNGDLVALRHSRGMWLDCNHTEAHCGVESVYDGDVGSNEWTTSRQHHWVIRNKLGGGAITDGSKVFLEYQWEAGQCLRPSQNLLIGNVLVTDVCNENVVTGICDEWTIQTATPAFPTEGPTTTAT